MNEFLHALPLLLLFSGVVLGCEVLQRIIKL